MSAAQSPDTPPRANLPKEGALQGDVHRFPVRVYYEDTDAAGIVYYANYLKFMERARSDLIRAVGVDQAEELRRSGSAYAVVEVDIRYRKPGRLGDELQVVTTVDQVRASSVHIQQRVMRGPEQLTTARVVAAFLDREGRPKRQPHDWVEKFRSMTAQGQ
jgi:acyl-CoA thioester hydrolase